MKLICPAGSIGQLLILSSELCFISSPCHRCSLSPFLLFASSLPNQVAALYHFKRPGIWSHIADYHFLYLAIKSVAHQFEAPKRSQVCIALGNRIVTQRERERERERETERERKR